MMAFTLGEATAMVLGRVRPRAPGRSGAPHRTGAPVRRDSIEAGSFEDLFFAVPAKGECDRMLRAARTALDTGRRLRREARVEGRVLEGAERTIAALTAAAVRVFEELCALARLNRGRVFPSYDRLAAATALGRATVARALASLEAAGFLVRQRRFVRVEGEGPRYAQISNAYRLIAPRPILRFLPRWHRPAPLPDDVVQHVADEVEAVAAMRASLGCRDLAQATVGGALGRVLARLGAALDDDQSCESHFNPEPLHRLIDTGKKNWPSRPTHGLTGTRDEDKRHAQKPPLAEHEEASATPPQCSLKGSKRMRHRAFRDGSRRTIDV